MRILFYLLTAFFGLIGILGILRTAEVLLLGVGPSLTQLIIIVVALMLAVACLRKARSAA